MCSPLASAEDRTHVLAKGVDPMRARHLRIAVVAAAINIDYTQGRIAIFNEFGDVRIDDVVVQEWP